MLFDGQTHQIPIIVARSLLSPFWNSISATGYQLVEMNQMFLQQMDWKSIGSRDNVRFFLSENTLTSRDQLTSYLALIQANLSLI